MSWNDDADEEWVAEEDPSDDDLLLCPSCGREVHEDTQQCPHCGDWITPVYPTARSRRWIWILAAVAVILSMTLWAVPYL